MCFILSCVIYLYHALSLLCEWLQNMYLCMRVIMHISNLFPCCVYFLIVWYVCVTFVFLSLMYIININLIMHFIESLTCNRLYTIITRLTILYDLYELFISNFGSPPVNFFTTSSTPLTTSPLNLYLLISNIKEHRFSGVHLILIKLPTILFSCKSRDKDKTQESRNKFIIKYL